MKTRKSKHSNLIVGFDVPAEIGMEECDISTPALVIELDAFERNVKKMAEFAARNGVRLRAHAKTHKSFDIARYQIAHGGACGICCQKVSEAEALVLAGIEDVLVSNQVVGHRQIDRLARLAGLARMIVCVDAPGNIEDLSLAATEHGVMLECLVEIDCGGGRCGVAWGKPAVELALKISEAEGLVFSGLQAYHGAAQHIRDFGLRRSAVNSAVEQVAATLTMLKEKELDCAIVGGAGTGTYGFEGTSGIYNELQCGSYIFMDADYQRVLDADGKPISEFENSLFVHTSVMSHVKIDRAICDAGLKSLSVDSGLPVIFGRCDLEYINCSDEHGVIRDPQGVLELDDRLRLIPGHCDPTCNLFDWYVGVRNGTVETLWPVTARGRSF